MDETHFQIGASLCGRAAGSHRQRHDTPAERGLRPEGDPPPPAEGSAAVSQETCPKIAAPSPSPPDEVSCFGDPLESWYRVFWFNLGEFGESVLHIWKVLRLHVHVAERERLDDTSLLHHHAGVVHGAVDGEVELSRAWLRGYRFGLVVERFFGRD